MKYIFYISLIILFANVICSQETKVERNFGSYCGASSNEYLNSIYTTESKIIGIGTISNSLDALESIMINSNPNVSNNNAIILIYDKNGIPIKGRHFGSTDGNDSGIGFVDNEGNIYVAGVTNGSNLELLNAFDNTYESGSDCYISKFDSNLNLKWSTYLGGNGSDVVRDIVVDMEGSVLVCGYTTSSNLATTGAFKTSYSGNEDGFIAKYDKNGNNAFITYFGDVQRDRVRAITIDDENNIFIGGSSESTNNISFNGYQNSKNSSGNGSDAFLSKFNTNGSLVWSTWWGGSNSESIKKIVNFENKVYCVGYTNSSDIIGNNGFNNTKNIGSDGFISVFETEGNLVWSTYLGGTSHEYIESICLDPIGNIYILGTTTGSTNLTTPDSYQINENGNNELFFSKISYEGELEYTSYYGGEGNDDISTNEAKNITFDDENGDLILTFRTNSSNNVFSNNAYDKTLGGATDIMLVSLSHKYNISTSEVVGGSTTLDKTGYIKHGQPLNITFKAEQGYYLQTYSINSTTYSASNSVRIDAVRNPLTITPYFVIDPLGDIDDDGVNNQLELDSPNNGDSNNDGILDLYQANVTSIVDSSSNLKMSISTNLSKIYEVEHIKDIDDVHDYPYGLNAFKVNGNVTEISIIYYDLELSKEYVYRKQKSDGSFYTLANAEYELLEINGVNALKITFEVIDGGAGDFDGIINGVIYDPGGLAILNINNNIPIWDWWWILIITTIIIYSYLRVK